MPRPFYRMDDDKNPEQRQRKVGIYDRPAGADRARHLKVWVLVVATVASVLGAYFFLSA
jgi:hypothetical protein